MDKKSVINYILDSTYKYEHMVQGWVDDVYTLISNFTNLVSTRDYDPDMEEMMEHMNPEPLEAIRKIVEGHVALEEEYAKMKGQDDKWAEQLDREEV